MTFWREALYALAQHEEQAASFEGGTFVGLNSLNETR